MTIETQTDRSSETAGASWMPDSRRQSERPGRYKQPYSDEQISEECVFPAVSPPVSWPRVFPGL